MSVEMNFRLRLFSLRLRSFLLAVLAGKILFFGTVLAPKVFTVLSRENASLLQNSIFPGYYTLGIVLLSTCLLLELSFLIGFERREKNKRSRLALVLISICLAAYLFSYFYLVPQLKTLSLENISRGVEPTKHFAFLHSLSKNLNLACFFSFIYLSLFSKKAE